MHVMLVRAGVELLPAQTRKEDMAMLADDSKQLSLAVEPGRPLAAD